MCLTEFDEKKYEDVLREEAMKKAVQKVAKQK